MGCCVSTDENKSKHDPNFPCISKSPPRPEEETVKEVLSETPQPRPEPDTGPIKNVGPDPDPDRDPGKVRILKPTKPKPKPNSGISQKHLPINPVKSPGSGRVCTTPEPEPEPEPEEVSDVSEMCSLSESISTATIREDEHCTLHNDGSEVVQGIHKPIPKGQNGNFTHRGCASPGRRRSDPSPTRTRITDPGPGPGPGTDRVMSSDPGQGRVEGQRRSRSPVTRSNSNCRQSPSRRRAGLSPGRVRMVSGQKRENEVKKMEEVNNERRRGNENENESEWDGPNESLENPLVSLECFIFL